MGDKIPTIPPETFRYLTVGIEFIAVFLFFLALGYWVDQRWPLTARFPVSTVVGMVVGFAAAMYRLMRVAREHEKQYRSSRQKKDS
ncbi:MAG: AtpZ/AtpI family protein [Planctomycetes bacterium]|nr:AtpZ/AtpI family protein [Planctomycetota bacterium]